MTREFRVGDLVRWRAVYGWAYGTVIAADEFTPLVADQCGLVDRIWRDDLEHFDDPQHPLAHRVEVIE